MAIAIKFYLNDIETKCPPQNWQALELELNFDKDKENTRNRISITDFDFVNENADIINAWITSGLLNGVGILEGLPFRIEIERGAITEQAFNGYLDPFGTTFSIFSIPILLLIKFLKFGILTFGIKGS